MRGEERRGEGEGEGEERRSMSCVFARRLLPHHDVLKEEKRGEWRRREEGKGEGTVAPLIDHWAFFLF